MVTNKKRKEILTDLIEDARKFRLCGPSDDPDEQTAVTSGYRYLVTQFKRLATPVLASPPASQLNAIEVEIDNVYSTYDAKAELDALLPEIEAALERLDDEGSLQILDGSAIIAESRLVELRTLVSPDFDFRKLVRLCEETNLSYGQQSYYATPMLIRGIRRPYPPGLWVQDLQ